MSLGDDELDDPQDVSLPVVHYPQCHSYVQAIIQYSYQNNAFKQKQ